MSNLIAPVSDDTFENEVIKSDKPVLVDFWAPWCGPCRQLTPILEELANDFETKVKFVKVNVDENSQMGAKFSIRSIPTLMIFKDGAPAATQVGGLSKPALVNFINSNI
jgi:thioredoxin 1